jgi:GDP-4-dehydro-6-deoxy-D-mannose reductase
VARPPERPTLVMTGGTGFIGGHLAAPLARMFPDHRRVMVARGVTRRGAGDWELASIDLTHAPALEALIERTRPSIVVHLAAESAFGASSPVAEPTWTLNVGATLTLARSVARYAPESLLFFASTAQVYGASFLVGPVGEETPAAPMTSYAVSKLAAEHILRDVLSPSNQLIVTRAVNQCGPGQSPRFVLASFAEQVARAEIGPGSPVIEVGNLEVERDFLHVADSVDAYLALMRMRATLPRLLTVNVASGRAWKLRTVLDMMRVQARRPIEVSVTSERERAGDLPTTVVDASRLSALTGWAPRLGMEEIVNDLLRDFRPRSPSSRRGEVRREAPGRRGPPPPPGPPARI